MHQHWHIENQQHWVLDVTYREDVSRLGDRESAEVFALLRRIALNMAQQHPKKISKRRKIKCSCWSDDFRMEMFLGLQQMRITYKKYNPALSNHPPWLDELLMQITDTSGE